MPRPVAEFDNCVCKKETDKALLVTIDGTDVWVPKSVVTDESCIASEGDKGELSVHEWWAVEKGLV